MTRPDVSRLAGEGGVAADVTVLVTTIPPRVQMLRRALGSVGAQRLLPDQVVVQRDDWGLGAAENRNRGLARVRTGWVAFLDDDDELLPHHLSALVAHQQATGADVVYPWFEPVGMPDPLGRRGLAFDAEQLRAGNYVPVPVLARVGLVKSVGAFTPPPWASPDNPCEDWGCWLKMLDAGALFVHLDEVTWRWHCSGANTSGRNWADLVRDGHSVGV